MRLKQFIFALVAMLLCAFSANAQVTTEAALKEALTAGGEVTLGGDIEVTAQIEIPAGVTVVLDLAGYEIIGGWNGSSTTNHIYALSNRGTLTIKDSGTEGKIVSRGVYNYGSLTLESGTIDACDGNGGYAVNNESGSTFVMNGGVVSTSLEDDNASEGGGYDATALDVPSGCTATLNGGKVTSVCDFTFAIAAAGTLNVPSTSTVVVEGNHGAVSVSGGVTTIDAGTFKVIADEYTRTDNVTYVSGGKLIINGGTFIGDSDSASGGCCVFDKNGDATINGGSFSGTSGGDVWGTTGTSINGGTFENLTETQYVTVGATISNGGTTYTKAEDGTMEETTFVAKIGSTTYATFAEALTAASAMTGDVEVEIYDKVTLNSNLAGNYSSIKFVGKDDDAEIYLDVQGYITTTDKKVAFEGLTLSKSAGGFITNAGFMNVAFGVYDVTEVTYTNCTFANGAYASSGVVTFTGCTFYRSNDKYGLWAYGDADITVDGCTFADYRGIKMYAEGAAKVTDLTVKDTDFSAVTDKPAIVLTYGESVTLEGNTYSSTGTFELDLDGAPNGTTVTSDVAPTCKNDNGACGVLVNGQIYTTVADAAAVATEGSNVTLLYSTTDAVEFAEGVNLTLADGVTAENVTVKVPAVAKIGETSYATLEEAIAAVGAGDVVIELLDDVTLDYGAREAFGTAETTSVTINGNGKTLTLNQTNSDWSSFGLAAGKAVFNNMTIEKTGYGDTSGAWNTHAIIFSCPVEMNTVTVNNSMAVQAGATLTDVTINEANGFYGLWVNGNGQTVTMTGGAINATNGGRGIKVADQYIDAPAQVTLNVTGTTFNTAKKAAVLVSSTAGAKVTASEVDITNVAADNQNMVWVDEDWAANYGTVEVTGATVSQEAVESFLVVVKNGEKVVSYFKTLADAVAAAESGATITLMNGEHELPLFSDKELTFVGESKDGVIVNDAPDARTQGWNGSTFHFENLTAKGATENYHGLANGVVEVTYKNCNINGLRFLYAATVSFEGCAFNAEGVEHSFWTYGSSDITVTDCTFTYTDRAVNCYSENGAEHETDIAFTGCTFTYAGTADAPEGAVEINSGSVKSIELTMDECTAPEKGAMWFNSQWDSKGGANTVVVVDDVKVWPLVAKIGETGYATLADALTAANDGETVELVWAENNEPIAMNGAVFGKNVTITGTATVDWSTGNLFVGRGGEGNATVTFDGASLTSASDNASTGIHVSGREKDTNNKYDGTLVIKNSTIELDYLINKGAMSLDNSTLTVKNGFSIGGRPASETESGVDATATISLANNSKVIVNNHNGMGLGYEAIGVMNIDATSTFEATQAFLVTAKGTMNVAAGGAVNVNGTLTVNGTLVSTGNIAATIEAGADATIEISGGIYTQNVGEWCVEGYVALPDLNGNYVVGAKPTATVNNLGMTTVAAGDYTVYGSGDNTADMPLSFVMQFLADQTEEDMATSPYADWYGDFVITFTGLENGAFTADGCYLAGHYGSFGWVKVPVDGMEIEEGVRYPVMLGVGMGQKYDYICSSVEDFRCALYLTPEVLEANPNIQVNLELAVVDNSQGENAAAEALVNDENVYSVTDYTYDAEDFVVDPNYIEELTIDDAEGLDYTNDTDKTVGTLTYKRTLIEGIWNPLYLPFEVELTDELLAEYDFADYNQMISSDTNGDRVPDDFEMELFVYTSGTLEANYPYFVCPKTADACNLELILSDVTLYAAKEVSLVTSSVKNTFKLSGTYKAMDAASLAGCYAISTDGDWSLTEGLKPFRLYFTITDNNGALVTSTASKSIRIVVRGEDGFTGIEEVTDETNENVIFDLQGRRILEPQKGEMYIINGKKVIY